MTSDSFQIPLFPLPGLVLFPRTMMPLHIFEPRYTKLVRDVLGRDKRLATGSLKHGWEKDYYGSPPAHRTITVARILHEEALPGGRFNILLEGIERARILEEAAGGIYRVARAQSLPDLMGPDEMPPITEARREMVELADRLAQRLPKMRASLTNLENTHLHPGIIADHLAALLVRDAYERQSLLEERRVLRRIALLNVRLREVLSDPQSLTRDATRAE